ncbi:MAG TPA: glycogen synthase GlgA [Terriglobales bacterium]|jgi:starch synthase|nr:glycogen synthase GlgA [Terriglobales bacterium]
MHIAFVASECVPFSKTGGLADVVGALPRALAAMGHQVSVYLPRYRQTKLNDPQTVMRSITVPFDDRYRFCSVVSGGNHASGVRFYFVEYPPYFDRDALYGTSAGDYPDNAERFALFSRAVLEASKILGVPQVFHCHDWQSALVPVLLRTQYAEDPAFRDVATVFTIHNMGYQGLFSPDTLPLLTLPWDLFTISKMEFFGNVNFLKGALVYSDFITTVSRKYSQEIQTTEFGFGLEGVLRDRAATVTGILNGVDYDEWSPQTDKFSVAKYSREDLSGKALCKQDLLAAFGVTNADLRLPVIGIVSRFAAQKGFDLIAQVMDRLAREEMIVVALGAGDRQYEEMFLRLQKQFPQKIAVKVAYDNVLAHKIEAGSDMFLMPSRYEPCGLNQIYSLKYGTVPIVRATGGLDDTIEPWDARTGKGTGFKFSEYSGEALLLTIKQTLQAYRDQGSWQVLMRNGMAKDFSWNASAKEYVRIYERVRQGRAAGAA